jgi:hypothetical protein
MPPMARRANRAKWDTQCTSRGIGGTHKSIAHPARAGKRAVGADLF